MGEPGAASALDNPPLLTLHVSMAMLSYGIFSVSFAAAGTCQLRDARGMAYLAVLLQHPGREIHAIDLVRFGEAQCNNTIPLARTSAGTGTRTSGGDDGTETRAEQTTTTLAPPVAPLTGLPDPDGAAQDRPALTVKVDNAEIELPAYIMPGQAAYSVAIALGYGRDRAGRVGGHAGENVAAVGANAYRLRAANRPYLAHGTITPTGRHYRLANTQDHWMIDTRGPYCLIQ